MRPASLILAFSAFLAAPALGAEPLTEAQVRSRIEATGYTQVSNLQFDGQGSWRGRAARNGDPCDITLDAQGNLQDARELSALTMFDPETGEARAESPASELVRIAQ